MLTKLLNNVTMDFTIKNKTDYDCELETKAIEENLTKNLMFSDLSEYPAFPCRADSL